MVGAGVFSGTRSKHCRRPPPHVDLALPDRHRRRIALSRHSDRRHATDAFAYAHAGRPAAAAAGVVAARLHVHSAVCQFCSDGRVEMTGHLPVMHDRGPIGRAAGAPCPAADRRRARPPLAAADARMTPEGRPEAANDMPASEWLPGMVVSPWGRKTGVW